MVLRDLKVAQQQSSELGDSPLFVYNFNDLFVWAVLQRRHQMALFQWQHGEEAKARATVPCKLYRAMAYEFRQSNMDDTTGEQLKTYSMSVFPRKHQTCCVVVVSRVWDYNLVSTKRF